MAGRTNMGNDVIVPGSAAFEGKSPGEGRRGICSLALPSGSSVSRIGFRVFESTGKKLCRRISASLAAARRRSKGILEKRRTTLILPQGIMRKQGDYACFS